MLRNEEDAQLLQRHAIEALSEVRAWVWAHHARQLPDSATVTREQAESYAAYLEWFSRIDAAIRTLDPATAEQHDEDQTPPFGV